MWSLPVSKTCLQWHLLIHFLSFFLLLVLQVMRNQQMLAQQFKMKQAEEGLKAASWRDCDPTGRLVLNAEDQAFLTNLTFQFVQQHPQENVHTAWIGQQDKVKEGDYIWVNGKRIHPDVIHWRQLEPNNLVASWDKDRAGQDCVTTVPLRRTGQEDWLNSWDDVV